MTFRRPLARCTITKYTIKAAADDLHLPMTLEDADRFLEGNTGDLRQRLEMAGGRIVAAMLRQANGIEGPDIEDVVDEQDDQNYD